MKNDNDCIKRVSIENVTPSVDDGKFPVKRVTGDRVIVESNIFADAHDALSCDLLYRKKGAFDWERSPMEYLGNDRWQGLFTVDQIGMYVFTVCGWVDGFKTWQRDLLRRIEAGQEISVELRIGAALVSNAAGAAEGPDRKLLLEYAGKMENGARSGQLAAARSTELELIMRRFPPPGSVVTCRKNFPVTVDRKKARFSTWYEVFPRSCSGTEDRHGTFKDLEALLPYIAGMGFDVLYLPPVHPIGRTHRKGPDNTPGAGPEDPGSPWAIGGSEGGHKSIHPQLGTLSDFSRLIDRAAAYDIEIALDIAFQCSPDHPYVSEHPEWFRRRPDGSIQYAENPPKKYQDIYPFDFETPHWRKLARELRSVVFFWIDQGVRIFRVDNPHTKPFRFWEDLIAGVKEKYPEVIFLSEAFTRPAVMYRLAKLGFTQSYTYFAWRNTGRELKDYFTELKRPPVCDFFTPNLWPNTPDILTEYLQTGGRPAFIVRLVLAATLGASYGIYGPAFELCEDRAKEIGSEEYLNSEKYQIRGWNLEDPRSLKDIIARVNRIRKETPALQENRSLRFHEVDNDRLLCFSKNSDDGSDVVMVVVNLDPHHTHGGWVDFFPPGFSGKTERPFQMHDLLGGSRFLWTGGRNYVELNPSVVPAHIFRVRRRIRTERDFDYYM
ncbi:MAG TPA: alpha-1,4-glucan--maltose-1-phosphate maltosyltransferase [Desulfobacteraceae bacterium]|nr:alpha-1,4-glucan--maltose-1-phosphate maltosyltransferase [Desulfobacteraceae bacterium]